MRPSTRFAALLLLLLTAAGGARADLVAMASHQVVSHDYLNGLVQSTDLVTDLRDFIGAAVPASHGGNTGIVVLARGLVTVGDGLGGLYYWDATSSAADDGVNVIKPTQVTGAGRWRFLALLAGAMSTDGSNALSSALDTIASKAGQTGGLKTADSPRFGGLGICGVATAGQVDFWCKAYFTGNGSGTGIASFADTGNANGVNITLLGNGGVTPSKTLRVEAGHFGIMNDARTQELFTLSDNGNLAVVGTLTGTQLVSTIASGTPPLSVASSTLVPNLNANYLGGATFAAPGPIGSATPNTIAGTTGAFSGNLTVTGASLLLTGNQSAPAWTTNGIRFANQAATLTDTTSSGTVPAAYSSVFGGSTIAASNAATFTKYAGTYFKDPIAGNNVIFTAKYALATDSLLVTGAARFGPVTGTVTAQSGTGGSAYTFAATDCGTLIKATGAGAATYTVPNSLPAGCNIAVSQETAGGQVTIAAGAGATFDANPHGYTKTFGQNAIIGVTVKGNVGGAAAEFTLLGDGA